MIGIGNGPFGAAILGRPAGGAIAPPPPLPDWAGATRDAVEALYHDATTRGVRTPPEKSLGRDPLPAGMTLSGGVLTLSGAVDLGGRQDVPGAADRGGWDFGTTPVILAETARVTGFQNCRIRLAEGDPRPALTLRAGNAAAEVNQIAWCEIIGGFAGTVILSDPGRGAATADTPLPRIGHVERNFIGGIGAAGYQVPSGAVVRWNYIDAPGNLAAPAPLWTAGTAYAAGALVRDPEGRSYVAQSDGTTAPLPDGTSSAEWQHLDLVIGGLRIGGADARTEVYANFLNRDPATRIVGAHRGAAGRLTGIDGTRSGPVAARRITYARNLISGPEGGGAVPLRPGTSGGLPGWEAEHFVENWITPSRDGLWFDAPVQSGTLPEGQQSIGNTAYDRTRILTHVADPGGWDISDGAVNDWPMVAAPSLDTGYAAFGA